MSQAYQSDLLALLEPPVRPVAAILTPRPYQEAARSSVAAVHASERGALVVLPTGTGKSLLCGLICLDQRAAGRRVLVTAPTIVLCQQMYEGLRRLGLRVGIEQADNRVSRPLPDVVVASVATMRGDRLKSFPRDAFGLVVADEAHRSVSDGPLAIFEWFESAKRLGLTATPQRVDGISLANVFDQVAYQMSMLDAISQGWLVPIRFKTAVTDFDAKALRTIAGEISAGSVESEIVRSGLLHEAANTLAELAEGERTVAFLPTVASSKAFVGEMAARGVPAEHVDGTTDKDVRNEVFARFKCGETRVLSNVAVLTEGWDCPEASVIALLNPTKSWSRITQMIGRGTRLCPGKESALVIDFCPGRLRKGRLASPADALAGKMLPDDVFNHIGKEGNLAEAIQGAERTAVELEEKKRQAREKSQRQAGREAELAALARKRAFTYGVQDHDAAGILGGQGGADRGYTSGEVDVAEDVRRKSAGMCSVKQSKHLIKHGLNPDMKRKLAGEVMDALSANGWRTLPDTIRNDRRFYAPGMFPGDLAARALEQLKGGK